MRFRTSSALVALCMSAQSLAETFDLSSLKWTLKNANGSIHIPATIPSQAHLDLMKAGIITEPLLGINGVCTSMIKKEGSTLSRLGNQCRLHAAVGCIRQLDVHRRSFAIKRRSKQRFCQPDIASLLWHRYRR